MENYLGINYYIGVVSIHSSYDFPYNQSYELSHNFLSIKRHLFLLGITPLNSDI